MAIAFVQTKTPNNLVSSAALSSGAGSAVGSGNCVVGAVTFNSNSTSDLTSVTDNQGNTYTIVDIVRAASTGQVLAIFFKQNITNGPTTITANFAFSVNIADIIWSEFSGLTTTDPRDGHTMQNTASVGTGTDAITSGNITTTTAGDLIYGATVDIAGGTSGSIAQGTGYTDRSNWGASFCKAESKVQGSAGSVAATFTGAGSSDFITGVVAFKAATSGVSPLSAGGGSYALTGTSVNLLRGRKLAAGTSSYSLTGTAATLRKGRILAASASSYSLTGTTTNLLRGRKITASAGSYTTTGTVATLVKTGNKVLNPDAGAYTLSGSNAGLLRGRVLKSDGGVSYNITGTNATLTQASANEHLGKRRIKGKIIKRRTVYPNKGFV